MEITVAWDSEYTSTKTEPELAAPYADDDGFCPISDQLYVLHDGRRYFIEHVGIRITLTSLIDRLIKDYPGLTKITLVTHFGRVELGSVADGRDWALANSDSATLPGSALAISGTIIGKWTYNGVTVDLWDTILLHPSSQAS